MLCASVAIAVTLTACHNPPPDIVYRDLPVTVEVPAELRYCMDAPGLPYGQISQRDVAALLVAFEEAGEDCREKLAALIRVLDAFEQRVEERRAEQQATDR